MLSDIVRICKSRVQSSAPKITNDRIRSESAKRSPTIKIIPLSVFFGHKLRPSLNNSGGAQSGAKEISHHCPRVKSRVWNKNATNALKTASEVQVADSGEVTLSANCNEPRPKSQSLWAFSLRQKEKWKRK